MKKLALLFFLVAGFVFSQESQKQDFSKEIDEQLWQAFSKAYNARDAEAYIALHTDDILRITKNGIRKGEVFREGIIKSYSREDAPKREIDFKFEHRVHSTDVAYEVGYFQVTSYEKEGEKKYYGRFSVLLRKVDGKWKIAQDWDVDNINGTPITEADFNKL